MLGGVQDLDELKDRTLFAELDQHAKDAPITSATSYSELTDYLSAKFPKDKRKRQLYLARGLLVWLCYHIDSADLNEDAGSESPLQLLAERTDYSYRAFQVLCEKNDIECKIVSGIVRGVVGYEVGDIDTELRGNWNAVNIDGTWRLIHSNWACSSVVGYQRGGWIKKESDGISTTERIESRSGITISQFDDDWFCMKPTIFLYRCYPDEPIWQLVPANKQIKSVEDFLKLPFLTKEYFDLGLHLTSKCSCLLTVNGGKEEITFHMGRRGVTKQSLSYSLYVTDVMESTTENITDRMVLNWQDMKKDTSSFELRFPVAGVYKLKMYVTDHDAGIRSKLGEFKIICKAPTKDFRPLPIDSPYGWGFTCKASEYGLANPSMTSPKIPIKATENKKQKPENIASLVFTIKKNLVDSVGYQSSLHGSEYSDDENASLQQYVTTNVNKRSLELTVQATVPVAGEFALVIEAVIGEPRLEYNVPVCTYLLTTLEERHVMKIPKKISLPTTPAILSTEFASATGKRIGDAKALEEKSVELNKKMQRVCDELLKSKLHKEELQKEMADGYFQVNDIVWVKWNKDYYEDMMTGIPDPPADPPAPETASQPPSGAPTTAATTATTPSGTTASAGGTATVSVPTPESGGEDPLAFLRTQPQFHQMRRMIQESPKLLPQLLQQIGQSNPQLLLMIQQNQERFVSMLNEEQDEAQGDGGGGTPAGAGGAPGDNPGVGYINVTQQEKEAIDRLKVLGFPEALCIQAYFACEKDEDLAANFLLGMEDDDS